MIQATLHIYGLAARDAGAAFGRSALALAWLVVTGIGVTLIGALIGGNFVGGIIVYILQTIAAGTYLASLQDALGARRSLSTGTLRANLGAYASDIMSALFPIWILRLGTNAAGGMSMVIPIAASVLVFLFLNPLPEMIGRVRASGMELIAEAWAFMGRAGPEWLAPQLLLLGGVAALLPWSMPWPAMVREAAGVFSPEMGFMGAAALSLRTLGLSLESAARAVGLVALVHLGMLFRGALWVRLESGSRRSREWQDRLR